MGDRSVKILIADDDPEDIELIEEFLLKEKPDLRLSKFMDGLTASEYLQTLPDDELPSLIILDYNMPGLTGAQVLSSLRSSGRYASIPKVVLSTSNTPRYIQESMLNGASEYIVKPQNMKEIHSLAKRFVSLAAGAR